MTGRRTTRKARSAFVLVIATAWSVLSPGAGSPPLSAEETQIRFSDKETRESCRGASNPSPGCTIRLHADPSSGTATLSVSSDTGANGTMPSEDVASWGTAVLSAQYPAGAEAGQLTFSAAVPVKQAAWETKSASGQAYASAAVYMEIRDASGRVWVDSAPIPRSMPQGTVIPVSVTLPAGSAGKTVPVRVGLSAFAGVGNTAPTMYLPHEVCASYGWDGPCASLPLGYPFKRDPGRAPNPMYYAAPNPTAVGKATFLLEATGVTLQAATASRAGDSPGEPLNVAATAGSDRVNLKWSPPSDAGGSPVWSYNVYRWTEGDDQEAMWRPLSGGIKSTSFSDSSAKNGIPYTYTVSAVNSAGEGARSSPVSAIPSPVERPAPVMTINDVVKPEGSGAPGQTTPFEFTVTVSPPAVRPVTVDFAATAGSALPSFDFAPASGRLQFNPGESAKKITVQVVADRVPEKDENFTVSLTTNTNSVAVKSQGIGVITEDDGGSSQPVLQVSEYRSMCLLCVWPDTVRFEGDNGGYQDFVFRVFVSSPSGTASLTVDYFTSDGTANSGSDFIASSGTLTFLPGESSKDIIVPVLEDDTRERDEVFTVTLKNASHGIIAKPHAVGAILNDD